jgi:hypothetical protein
MVKASTPFQPKHKLVYALELVSTDGNGDVTLRCLFCLHDGRDVHEVVAGSSRKRKSRCDIKYFKKPFLPHKYRSHHSTQHAESWERYQASSTEEKKGFFVGKIKNVNTMHRHMDLAADTLTFTVKASIVESIIGDLFFRDHEDVNDFGSDSDDDVVGAEAKKAARMIKEKKNAMRLFEKIEEETHYTATIKNVMRFELAIDHVSIGMSFRQVAGAIQHAKFRTKMSKLSGINDLIVGQYVRVLVATNLQAIADMLDDDMAWAFSLAGDGSTHRGQPFFDLRVRICLKGRLHNLHLVAIPMFERRTALNIFSMLAKFLDALYSKWRSKLIGMSSDGENTMTGRHAGLVTRIVACAENPVLRIWCPPHQIDLVVKSSSAGIAGGTWVAFAWSFSVFLRAQANLITSMGVKCPKKTNRWTHLGRLLTFFKQNRRMLVEYTTTNRPEQTPTSAWWVTTFAVSPAIDVVNSTFVILQSRSLLISQQEQHVHALIATLTTMLGVQVEEDLADDDVAYESFGSLRIPVDAIVMHIKDQGSFAIMCYDDMDAAEKTAVVHEIASYALSLITGLMGVKAERNDSNVALDGEAPPVLPAQLVKLRPGAFVQDVLEPFRIHIAKFWTPELIDEIEADHRDLRSRYSSDQVLRAAIDGHDSATSFDSAWDCAPGRFAHLRAFCGGLATVFANTTSVESDFSILKWEMDEFRSSLMHLSLEGVLQAKQMALVRSIM